MTSYTIENNVPIPNPLPRDGKWVHFLREMKIGDSIQMKTRGEASSLVLTGRKRFKFTMTLRKITETEFRVWRVK